MLYAILELDRAFIASENAYVENQPPYHAGVHVTAPVLKPKKTLSAPFPPKK